MKKFCSNCGSQLDGLAKYCPACGADLNGDDYSHADHREQYIPDDGIEEMFFRRDNRLNRQRYILRLLILVGVGLVIGLIIGIFGGITDFITGANFFVDFFIGLTVIALLIPNIILKIRRLHDLDRPVWWIIGTFIPVVCIVFDLYLIFARGTIGANQYGPDPLS